MTKFPDDKKMGLGSTNKHSSIPKDKTENTYIVSCDIGTTELRCIIYDDKASIIGSCYKKVQILYPKPGFVEINPHKLWETFIYTITNALQGSNLTASQIRCLGLSTQRGTFVLWDRLSGTPLHNLITWKDIRADALVRDWNNSWIMKVVRITTGILYHVMRKKRYLAASILRFQNLQVNMRLKWVLENNENVKEVMAKGNLMFGTVDTWLIYKLTGGKVHATDPSNASGTAIYDPYIMEWSSFLTKLLHMPQSMFPEIRDSIGHWGETQRQLFGSSIPITAVVSDQGAAMFGGCGFNQGDVKMTLGTGAFLNLNTGSKPHTSITGIYPVVGWKDRHGMVYMAEGSSNDNGTVIEWGKHMGFYSQYADTSAMAESVESSRGVYFIPGFQGLQAPVNDAQATGGFLGLTVDTRPEHLVRAMLESLAFRVYQIYRAMKQETNYEFFSISKDYPIRIDGGVAQNDFMMQMVATLTNKKLERPKNIETSSLGCCFLAGIGAGVWKDKSAVEGLREIEKTFHPQPERRQSLLHQMGQWEKALDRFTKWHPKEEGCKDKDVSWNYYLESLFSKWDDGNTHLVPDNEEQTPPGGNITSRRTESEMYSVPKRTNLHDLFFYTFTNQISVMYSFALFICFVSYFYFGW